MPQMQERATQRHTQLGSCSTTNWLDGISERLSGIRKPRPVRTPPGEAMPDMPEAPAPAGAPATSNELYLQVPEHAFRDLVELAQSLVSVAAQLYTWTATAGTRTPDAK